MIRSMTAFAVNDTEVGNMALSCELRSVNHRYLDISLKLPEWLRFAENDIRALIGNKISRGKIECNINLKKQMGRTGLMIDKTAVEALIAAATEIEHYLPAALPYSALDILAFPGIQQEPELDKAGLIVAINNLVIATVEQLAQTRAREGAQLKALIEERCHKIRSFVSQATQRIPQAQEGIRTKLLGRLAELTVQPDFDRLEQELVFLAQKLDVSEELDRLDTHITEVLRVINQPEPAGRRLDFLMQELNREANTLGSKSTDKELTHISVELKVLIEQIREQVQNIE